MRLTSSLALKNIMREAGPRISRLVCQVWPSVVRCEFFKGKLPKKMLYFHLGKRYLWHSETMKQQITPDLGKTEGDISEILCGALFKAQYRCTQK